MTLTLYPVPGKEKSKLICNAFAAGAPRHATGAVFFGTEGVMQAFQRAKQGTFWYIDNAYTDPQRQLYFRVAKNALQVDPAGKTSTGERFTKLGITVKDWRHKPDGKILVIPQSDDFMKSTLGRKGDWLRETVEKLNAWGYGPRIRVRPWQRNKANAYVELHKDLDDAALGLRLSHVPVSEVDGKAAHGAESNATDGAIRSRRMRSTSLSMSPSVMPSRQKSGRCA